MTLTSTLGSPGIEIREIDNSIRVNSSTATTIYVPGFASQGPVDEVMSIGTISDFETIYGVPTNAAERYFYYTVKAILDGSGAGTQVLCSRLPYGEDAGDTVSSAYTLLAYPAIPVIKKKHNIDTPFVDANGYYSFTIDDGSIVSTKDYNSILDKTITITGTEGESITLMKAVISDNDEVIYDLDCKTCDIIKKEPVESEDDDTEDSCTTTYKLVFGGYESDSVKVTCYVTTTNTGSLDSTDILDEDKSIENKLEHSKLTKTGSSEYIDFDQFIFDTNQKDKLANLFKIDGKTPRIDTIVLTLDDDSLDETVSTLTITNVENNITVPATTENYYGEDGEINQKIKAPTIDFKEGHTAKGLIAYENKDGNIIHLSYTIVKGEKQVGSLYIKLVYESITDSIAEKTISGGSDTTGIISNYNDAFGIADNYTDSDEITYLIGSPVMYHVSLSDYYKIITGELLNWSNQPYDFSNTSDITKKFGHFDALGHAAFIVINTSRSIINSNFEGFYLGITDNTFVSPSEDYEYNAIDSVKITTSVYDAEDEDKLGLTDKVDSTGDFQTLSTNRLSFHLANNSQGSISHVLSRNVTSMDISGTDYDDTINMALFKLTKSTDSSDILKLNYSIREKYNWSFDKSRLKSVTGSTRPVSAFVENVVENSKNLTILMNPYISGKTFVDVDGNIKGKIRVFGNKLLSNLEKFEKKYLCNNTSDSVELTKTNTKKKISAMVPATMARSSINSWATIVKQTGLTPNFIKKNLKNYNLNNVVDEDTPHDYKSFNPLNSIIPFGTYTKEGMANKKIGNLPAKLERALSLVENDEQYPDIDLILEGGLGTIFAYSSSKTIGSEGVNGFALLSETGLPLSDERDNLDGTFNENVILQGMEDLRTTRTSFSEEADEFKQNYTAIQNTFTRFANSMQNGGRGDTFYISDVPRGVVLKGKNTKVCNLYGSILENNSYDFGQTVNHSFATSIYSPIKHLFDDIVSSYMSTYAQWVRIIDTFSSEKVWIPISGYIAANMAATDGTYGPWYAAAGLRRGVINGTLDYALSPSISQRTDLYKICINSVPKIPNYGVTIWGIRTMGKKDSAFDQNTCRRTFLYMEKKVKQLLRYYIFEPNTSYTRLQIYNDIYPFMEKIKNSGGIYSYTLVCDTTNNTPDIINNGDLAVSIAAAPTRTAENIIVEFIANKYTEEIAASESLN